jgi:prepilin-type processing-associated H-X9-DG protein
MPFEMYEYTRIDFDHDGKVNMLYLDQSVLTIPQIELPNVLSDPFLD